MMNLAQEYVRCNLCDSDSFVPKFVGKDRSYKLPGDWTVVECSVCGLLYINPRPTSQSLSSYYPQTYWDVPDRPFMQTIWRLHTLLQRPIRYKMSIPKRTNGKLLDIGCGTGGFLASMKRSGWGAYGVELSPIACEYAEKKEELDVFNGTVEDASFPNDFFDAVTMHHVLEHTQDPTETLHEIHRILKTDGLLVIGVPNAASWESKLFGSRWFSWEIPRHLYHFSPATITALLERNGFSVLDIKYDASLNGFLHSMQYVFADAKLNSALGFALAYPLAYLVSVCALIFRSTTSIAVFAKKKL